RGCPRPLQPQFGAAHGAEHPLSAFLLDAHAEERVDARPVPGAARRLAAPGPLAQKRKADDQEQAQGPPKRLAAHASAISRVSITIRRRKPNAAGARARLTSSPRKGAASVLRAATAPTAAQPTEKLPSTSSASATTPSGARWIRS